MSWSHSNISTAGNAPESQSDPCLHLKPNDRIAPATWERVSSSLTLRRDLGPNAALKASAYDTPVTIATHATAHPLSCCCKTTLILSETQADMDTSRYHKTPIDGDGSRSDGNGTTGTTALTHSTMPTPGHVFDEVTRSPGTRSRFSAGSPSRSPLSSHRGGNGRMLPRERQLRYT